MRGEGLTWGRVKALAISSQSLADLQFCDPLPEHILIGVKQISDQTLQSLAFLLAPKLPHTAQLASDPCPASYFPSLGSFTRTATSSKVLGMGSAPSSNSSSYLESSSPTVWKRVSHELSHTASPQCLPCSSTDLLRSYQWPDSGHGHDHSKSIKSIRAFPVASPYLFALILPCAVAFWALLGSWLPPGAPVRPSSSSPGLGYPDNCLTIASIINMSSSRSSDFSLSTQELPRVNRLPETHSTSEQALNVTQSTLNSFQRPLLSLSPLSPTTFSSYPSLLPRPGYLGPGTPGDGVSPCMGCLCPPPGVRPFHFKACTSFLPDHSSSLLSMP